MSTKSPPRQLAKRDALVDAAARVMLHEGLAGCTVRAVAAASPLTKSALHYYFEDFEELLELAHERLVDVFESRIEAAAEAETDPERALSAAMRTFVELGSDRPDKTPLLWFEVQIEAVRSGRFGSASRRPDRLLGTFTQLVRRAGFSHPEHRASILFSALIGAVVRRSIYDHDLEELLADAMRAMKLPRSSL